VTDHDDGPVVAVVGEEWRRLHPASPIVRGWQPLVAVLALGLQDGFEPQRLAVTGVLAVVAVVVGAMYYWLSWRVARFRLDGPDLVVESGVLFKRSRRVPLARLQAVDIVQPLLARALGLAELRLEVAGGKSSDAPLAYLDLESARAVRNDLLVLAAGLRDDVSVDPAPPEAMEVVLATTPSSTLLAAVVLEGPAVMLLVVFTIALAIGVVTGEFAIALGAVGPILFGLGGPVWASFTRNYGTTLADSPDGLRIRRGLIETRSQTVPPGRVQGVVVREPLVWRLFGWVRVAATVAGYAGGDQAERSTTLLPVASAATAQGVVDRVLPGVDWRSVPLSPAPVRARWRAPVEGGRLGAGIGDDGAERVFVTRRGRFGQRTDVVPLARLQSVRLRQGPLQRWLGLASVFADVSPGPVRAVGLHRDAFDARALVDRLVTDARAARAAAAPDRWLHRPPAGEEYGPPA